MRIQKFLMLSVVVALISPRTHAQASPGAMTPGLWEITIQTRSPIVGPLLTHTVCIDKATAGRSQTPKTKASDDCQVSPEAAASNETAYSVRCAKRKISSIAKFTYSGSHFEGVVTINTPDGEVKQVYAGVRVGDCDDADAPPAK
jgi:hypothetical protein